MSELSFKELREVNAARGDEWNGFPMSQSDKYYDLLFRSNEMAGECGEACNAVKKLHRCIAGMKGGVDLPTSKAAIEEELADVIICVDRVAEALDIHLSDAIRRKFNKTSDKYGLKVRFPEETLKP